MRLPFDAIGELSDDDLLAHVRRAVDDERHATAQLIALLMEVDKRRLYLREGCSSLFTYCTQVLHLSEHAAYNRIETARAVRRFPVILEQLTGNALTLTAVRLVSPHLTEANHAAVLASARHKSKREIEDLVARLYPQPDAPAAVRKLPPPASAPRVQPTLTLESKRDDRADERAATVFDAPSPRSEVRPLAPERYKVQFTMNRETYDRLRRVQDLMRRTRAARPPATNSRHIPAAIKRAVWRRDGGRCAFKGTQGRCSETGFLEFHHLVPFADGGETSIENLELRCRAHNEHEADRWFGPREPTTARETRTQWRHFR